MIRLNGFIGGMLIALMTTSTTTAPARAAELDPTEQRVVQWVDAHTDEAIALLEETVNIPSATMNVEGNRKVGAVFAREFEEIGFKTSWAELPPEMKRAGHLFAERTGTQGKRLLLIGHLDTVLEGKPFRREGNLAHGMGTSDMKGGNVIIVYALKALHAAGALDDTRIIVAFTGDEEEPARPLSVARAALIDAAKRSDAALAFEGVVENTATVARRGVTGWHLHVTAKTGHSSLIFRDNFGSGAIFEAARILNAFHEELRGEQYLSFNPSIILGGTNVSHDAEADAGTADGKHNVIPQAVIVEGDVRTVSLDQLASVQAKMKEIVSRHLPGTSAEITFGEGYPPMAPTEGNYRLLAVLDQVSRDLGFGPVPALDPVRRGAGDVSFVAPYVDSLDGLGSKGFREHAPEEHVDLEAFPVQIKRAALLIYRLTRKDAASRLDAVRVTRAKQ